MRHAKSNVYSEITERKKNENSLTRTPRIPLVAIDPEIFVQLSPVDLMSDLHRTLVLLYCI